MSNYFRIKSLKEAEVLLPGFKKLWKEIKAKSETAQRAPKAIIFTDKPSPVYLNDGEMGMRFALNLQTMKLSDGLYISSGEWACHAGSNNDQSVDRVPSTHALLTFVWHDYYRTSCLKIQVGENMLPKKLG